MNKDYSYRLRFNRVATGKVYTEQKLFDFKLLIVMEASTDKHSL